MQTQVQTETLDVAAVTPAEYNPRITTEKGMGHLKMSLSDFGYVDPIIVNKRTMRIVGGHQRFKVMQEEGVERFDAVVVDLDEPEEKALNIALNKTSEHFEWDMEKLSDVVSEIKNDIDISRYGVDLSEITSGKEWEENDLKEVTKPRYHDEAAEEREKAEAEGRPVKKPEKPDPDEAEKREYQCPSCGHQFIKAVTWGPKNKDQKKEQ